MGFIAGVECDGASYHSGFTVRDRDRIRQSVLEGMGWRIYRIWSTDWFGDPSRELAKLLTQLDRWRADAMATDPRLSSKEEGGDAPTPPTRSLDEVDVHSSTAPINAQATNLAFTTKAGVPNGLPDERSGRPMRPIDDIEWDEMIQSILYEVWPDYRYAGEVERLSRPGGSAGIYQGRTRTTLPEYEGRMAATGERFVMHDIYAAVREVARRARLQPDAR